MVDYQVRGWLGWHDHMALVMVALTFLARERLINRETAKLFSCCDLIDIMRLKLPTKVQTDDDLVAMIEDCHRRRQMLRDSAHWQQGRILNASE